MKDNGEDILIKMIAYFESAIDIIENETIILELDTTNFQQKLIISLFLTINEISCSVKLLLRNNAHIAVPSLVRNMLEAYVDLKNLSKNEEYKFIMTSSYLKELKRFIENNEKIVAFNPGLLKDVKELLLNKNYKKLKTSFASRFQDAGLQELYVSIYNKLSRETHNNINCLIDIHFTFTENGYKIAYKKKKRIAEICFLIQICNKLHQSALTELLHFYKIKQLTALAKLKIINEEYDKEFIEFLK